MSATGFHLVRLKISGPNKPDAVVDFEPGLNVICGPSDTGKTFVFQCINYMLGSGKTPKLIPEAYGYETAWLSIRSRSGDSIQTLQRGLKGGDFLYGDEGQATIPLGAKHVKTRTDTASHVLVEMSGLADRIIKHKATATRLLTFRDLTRLVLVSEEDVIRERSPILGGQYPKATGEKSVFRLLLDGIDDSSLNSSLPDKKLAAHTRARSEVIGALIEKTQQQLAELGSASSRDELLELLRQAEMDRETASGAMTAASAEVSEFERSRRERWEVLQRVKSAMEVKNQLGIRFTLLRAQYALDIDRLQSMIEAHQRLQQMPDTECPTCGAKPEYQTLRTSLDESVLGACRAEMARTNLLLSDLDSTLCSNEAELTALRQKSVEAQSQLATAEQYVADQLNPRASAALSDFRRATSEAEGFRKALDLYGQLDQLAELKALKGDSLGAKAAAADNRPSARALEEFCILVHRILTEWHFPNLGRVTFSDTDMDLVISGKPRAGYGKGVRAITHAAFNLALLAYCEDKELPHPGFVLIDSPLVVYREPDPDETGFTPEVKDSFYRSVAEGFHGSQVIVMENLDPPEDLDGRANIVSFTGTSSGKRGFIPD